MPRRRAPPRLYLDRKRRQWIIRDGTSFIRTGCAEAEHQRAEKILSQYIGKKYQPERGPDPLIADVLLVYNNEHVPQTRSAQNTVYNVNSLAGFFRGTVRDITPALCRRYAAGKSPAAARRDLETLRAAIGYWHKMHGPLAFRPHVVLPDRNQSRQRWITRHEAARLLWASRRTEHLRRFILLGLYTGSRSGVILRLRWEQIDLQHGVMMRRAFGEAEDARKRTPPVRLGRRILSHLRRWRATDMGSGVDYPCHYNGTAITKLRRSWAAAVKRAGLGADVTPHVLRHTRATWLMQAGIDLWEASGHLGMTPETLRKTYGHHHPDFQKNASEV